MENKSITGKPTSKTAELLANLTFNLLVHCQEKEHHLAKEYGLTPAEFRCLRHFSSSEIKNNKEIVSAMMLSPSRMTRILDGLAEKKYISREIDSKDRRNMLIKLTKQGNIIASKLNSAYCEIHKEILAEIDIEEHEPLIHGMEHLLSALKQWVAKH